MEKENPDSMDFDTETPSAPGATTQDDGKIYIKPSRRTALATNENSKCPVELAIRIIGGKWKPIILWHLREEKKRFGELKREITGITVKMLAQQLREMEQDGILSRKMFYEVPPRVEYSLTDLGRSLDPVLSALCSWGAMYRDSVLVENEK